MQIEQIYTACLSQASYYIESQGEVAIVDPIRDIDLYINKAKESGHIIKYILETHFHADFVSGHIDLAMATGATIVFGDKAKCAFEVHLAADGEKLTLGNSEIAVLHTPGHTPESVCYKISTETNVYLFTGDTLFVGDVGRPDLCQTGANLTQEQMASSLYKSLHEKILTLPDSTIVYPGHGPGSACGKNLGPEKYTTLLSEKKNNYALQPLSEAEFIAAVCEGLNQPPDYFFADAALNQNGYKSLQSIKQDAKELSWAEFEAQILTGALIIDSRAPQKFEQGFIPKSVNIGLNGQYAIWAATLFSLDRKIILVSEIGQEEESIIRLSRVGFSNIKGYLSGGFEAFKNLGKTYDMVISISPEEFALDYQYSNDTVLDVRKFNEYEMAHLEDVMHIPLENLQQSLTKLNKNENYQIHCAGGYRSMIAASILKSEGFQLIKNIEGGFSKIKEFDLPIVHQQTATV